MTASSRLARRLASLLQIIFVLWVAMFSTTCGYDVHAQASSGYDSVVDSIWHNDAATTQTREERSSLPPGTAVCVPECAGFVPQAA